MIAPLFFSLAKSINWPYRTQVPVLRIYNSPNNEKGEKEREISQTCFDRNSNPYRNNNFFNNNFFNNAHQVKKFGGVDERAEVLAWLSPLELRIRHSDIRTHQVEGFCLGV